MKKKKKAGEVSSRRSWEEDVYWTHFRSIYFCQFLRHPDFRQRLEIPEKFAENLGKSLPKNVVLKGPSGSTWNVGLVLEEDDKLFFQHGWEDFVETYCLEENDILMFKYNGESSFDVLMFNYDSLCEKEVSYFRRKTEREVTEEDEQRGPKKKKHREEDDDVEGDGSAAAIPFGVPILDGSAEISRGRKETLFRKLGSKGKSPKDVSCISVAAINRTTDDEALQFISKRSPSSSRYPTYKSNRRLVTTEEVSSALKLAEDTVTSNGFLVVMRPTHVYKRFYLSVPVEWASKHLENRNREIVIRFGVETWNGKYVVTNRGTGGLSAGWKAFSLDNNLEESDVCVFDLAESINDKVVLDVTIFRVVEDVVPLTGPQ